MKSYTLKIVMFHSLLVFNFFDNSSKTINIFILIKSTRLMYIQAEFNVYMKQKIKIHASLF